MGYHSEVVIGIKKEAIASLLLEGVNFPFLLGQDYVPSETVNDVVYWTIHDIKWYDEFPDILEVIELMDNLDSMDGELYGFIRTGEDDTDTESRGCPWDLGMYVVRSIRTPLEI